MSEALLSKLAESDMMVSPQQVTTLSDLIKSAVEGQKRVADLEQQLADQKKEVERLKRDVIPSTMTMMGCSVFATENGIKVSVEDIVHARLNAKDLDKGIKWLDSQGLGSIVKEALTIKCERDEKGAKVKQRVILGLTKLGLIPEESKAIHWATLQNCIKEKLEHEALMALRGQEVPAADKVDQVLFNVYKGLEAKITVPKTDNIDI